MENQNDQVFEADQDVSTLERLRSRSAQSPDNGHRTTRTASGNLESQEGAETELTPLLGGSRGGDDDGDGSGGGNTGQGRKSTWDGEKDFEGRPWWNKPSVSDELCR